MNKKQSSILFKKGFTVNKEFARDMDTTQFTNENSENITMFYTVEITYNNGRTEFIPGLPSMFDIINDLENAQKDNEFWMITDYKIINPDSISTLNIHEDPDMNIGA